MLTFRFFGTEGMMTVYETITSGLVGKEVKLEFSAEWASMQKTAVFTAGPVTRDVLNVSDTVVIPHEVLQNPGDKLYVGIYGVSEDKTQITPTVFAQGPKIFKGADPSGDESTEPSLPVWVQLQGSIDLLERLEKDVATLQYDVIGPIDVTGISATPSVAELGSTVDSVTVTWAVNREPVSQTVTGEAVDAGARSAVVPGPFTATTSFEVVATDERGATDTATTRINFYNGIYYGPLASGVVPDSAAILGLTRKLQGGKGATISYTPADGKRPSYACPTGYGTPKFVIGGFEYAWTKLGTIQFENASGSKESYDIWQHPQDVTASMTITVS